MIAFLLFAAGGVPTTCPQRLSYEQGKAIAEKAEQGDGQAAHCLASRLNQLDGGLLEDASRALGEYGERHPLGLLRLLHDGVLSKRQLANAVSMLPLSLVDDFQAQLSALEVRRERFRDVATAELADERKIALASIDAALDETRPYLPRR